MKMRMSEAALFAKFVSKLLPTSVADNTFWSLVAFHLLGAVHILRQPPEGGEGVWQMLTIAAGVK